MVPIHFTTSASWAGSTIRTAMSASRRSKSSTAFDENKLDNQIRMALAQVREDRRQDFDTDDLAGAHPHRSLDRTALARGRPQQRRGRR